MDRQRILDRAKVDLMDPGTKNPNASPVFYSSILFSLKQEWMPAGHPIDTAAVDGRVLYINEDFFCSLTPSERVFVLAHECLHVGYRHIDYFHIYNFKQFSKNIENRLYNEAGDHRINLDLKKAGYDVIDWTLCDERFMPNSTFEIYKILHEEYAKLPRIFVGGGDIIFADPGSGTAQENRDLSDLQTHITDVLTRASITSQMAGEGAGSIPGGILRTLEEVLNPRLPFEQILSNYMTSAYARDDYSYARPNRRFLPDVLLPGAYGEQLCDIACWFDTSGSVDDKQLSSYRTGLRMISEQLHPDKITLGAFDTDIRGEVRDITRSVDLDSIEFEGGGGTRIKCIMDWIEENKPEVTLIFSDGDFYMPKEITVKTDIIWIIDNRPSFTAPVGKVIHYKI